DAARLMPFDAGIDSVVRQREEASVVGGQCSGWLISWISLPQHRPISPILGGAGVTVVAVDLEGSRVEAWHFRADRPGAGEVLHDGPASQPDLRTRCARTGSKVLVVQYRARHRLRSAKFE